MPEQGRGAMTTGVPVASDAGDRTGEGPVVGGPAGRTTSDAGAQGGPVVLDGPRRRPSYLRTACSPRMLLLLVLLLGAAAVCARLGIWQLDRAELRGEAAAKAEQTELVDAPPEPLVDVLAPQSP